MTSKRIKIAVLAALIIIVMVLLVFDVFIVEKTKAEVKKIAEAFVRIEYMKSRIKEAKIELMKQRMERDSVEIIEFDEEYSVMEDEYTEKAYELSKVMNSRFTNIDQIKELTRRRMDISVEFREKLSCLDIPEPLRDFYDFKLESLDNEIKTFSLVLVYYDSYNYSTYDDSKLQASYDDIDSLFLKAEQERNRIYRKYGLEYLLEQ